MISFIKIKIFLTVILVLCYVSSGASEASTLSDNVITMDLQEVSIQDAIRILAKCNHINVVMSPAIHGVVSLHLKQKSASEAFDWLLTSHALSKWENGNVWFVAPEIELVQRAQQKIKLQNLIQESSPLLIRTWQIHYAKAEEIAIFLQNNTISLLSKRGHVRVDTRTNTLCVQDTEDHLLEIQTIIKRLDVPVQQVLIDAHLASVDSDYERELGVSFSVEDSSSNGSQPSDHSHSSLAVIKLGNSSFLDAELAALENEGHGELISSPSLFTANQQTASIESGEEIPYQEISKSGATGITFKKAVLSLKVTPQIMPGNQVLLQLQVNQDKPNTRVVLGVPAISTRQISTQILVKNGQTVVLGGIYETNKENEQQRIPILGNIPIVGWLFGQQNVSENKRELLIFVTPKIIVTDEK